MVQVGNKAEVIGPATWPDDAPHRLEDNVISVVCGNSHLHWAVHYGKQQDFAPMLFWRTPPLHNDERQDDPCAVLARHLPKQAHAMIFGGDTTTPSKKNATDVSSKRRIAAMSVFIVSTNKEHESGLSFLFQDIKVRIFKLCATDFFSKEDGIYEGIGVDRVAALLAAATLNQDAPVMVFDAGTAWTYTALDRQRKIMGGGISPGVAARFRAMGDYCADLPIIEYEQYQAVVTKTVESKKPLPTFARDTKGAMMTTVFSEIANQSRSLVKQFLEAVKEEKKVDNGENKENTGEVAPPVKKPTIVVTGGDSLFLKTLLENDQPNLVAGEPGTSLPVGEFELSNMKHLVHHGIAQLLSQKVEATPSDNPDDQLREFILGLRVAQNFEVADDDGEFVYRGSVMSIKKDDKDFNEDLFVIKYDDGDGEQMDLKQLHDALKRYSEVGEKSPATNEQDWVVEKKSKAEKSVESLLVKSDKLKKTVEEEEKELNAAKERGDASETPKSKKRGRKSVGSPNTKRSKKAPESDEVYKKRLGLYVGRRVAKYFDTEIYYGLIDEVSNCSRIAPYWHVQYDDDDQEELEEPEIKEYLKLYEEHKAGDANRIIVDVETASAAARDGEDPPVSAVVTASEPEPMETTETTIAAPARAPKPTETPAVAAAPVVEAAKPKAAPTPAPPVPTNGDKPANSGIAASDKAAANGAAAVPPAAPQQSVPKPAEQPPAAAAAPTAN